MHRTRPNGLFPIGLARVLGESMLPALRPGDRLLVRYGAVTQVGDLVVARFADGTIAVKRASEPRPTPSGQPGWWLLSDNLTVGIDSRHRGAVPQGDVLARVLGRLWPDPGPIGTR